MDTAQWKRAFGDTYEDDGEVYDVHLVQPIMQDTCRGRVTWGWALTLWNNGTGEYLEKHIEIQDWLEMLKGDSDDE